MNDPLHGESALPTGMAFPTGTVTFLFTDIVGSTPLWESQPEKMGEALRIHNTALRRAIEAHSGVVFKTVGDAFQAAFATAPQALSAAIEGQRALQAAQWNELGELKVRMGLHTGEAELDPGGDEYAVSHTKNRAARIMSAAHGGQVLLSQETKDLVDHQLPVGVTLKDLGEHRLKGMALIERLYQVSAPGLTQVFPPSESRVERPHNLPVRLTSFIGRTEEIAAVCDQLLEPVTRFVTVTGVGGTGKTSLAVQVGRKLLDYFKDGAFFTDLTRINDPGLVMNMIAQALSVHEIPGHTLQNVLEEHLSRRSLLLILDNFEHVLPAAPDLVGLLRVAPGLKLLITSREPLRVSPERLYLLAPLPLPGMQEPLERLQENEAVSLFLERAQALKPGLRLTAENAGEISAICRQLDGLPLAIELAVPRLRLYSPSQLHHHLAERLHLLSGGPTDAPTRHQTMRAAIAWSCNLLSAEEQKLFSRLAVFPGSFTLEAAAAVCDSAELEVGLWMESLLDKNLVNQREGPSETRFWLFETLREYGLEQLIASGEWEGVSHGFAVYYATLYSTHRGQDYGLWDLERHNLRRAINWAIEAQDEELLCKWGYLFFAWERQVEEGRQMAARALALPTTQAHTPMRHDLLYSASALAIFARDFSAAGKFIQEFGVIGQEINYNIYQYPWFSSMLSAASGDFEGAIDLLFEAGLQHGDPFNVAYHHLQLASYLLQLHDYPTSMEHVSQAQKLFNQQWQPNPYVVDCLLIQGFVALGQDQPDSAQVCYTQSFQLALDCVVLERTASIFKGLGAVAMRQGALSDAVTWMSLAATIRKATGFSSRLMIDNIEQGYLDKIKSRLLPADFNSTWDAGQALTLEQAILFGKEHLLEKEWRLV